MKKEYQTITFNELSEGDEVFIEHTGESQHIHWIIRNYVNGEIKDQDYFDIQDPYAHIDDIGSYGRLYRHEKTRIAIYPLNTYNKTLLLLNEQTLR